MSERKYLDFPHYKTLSGGLMDLKISYKSFGCPLGTAPVVLVNHSLTGNADVTGEEGWWPQIIGPDKLIDTQVYSVLAFNFPGNGDDSYLIEDYEQLVLRDIAFLVKEALDKLEIQKLYAERWTQVHDAFEVRNTNTLKGHHVLLVDDVVTIIGLSGINGHLREEIELVSPCR